MQKRAVLASIAIVLSSFLLVRIVWADDVEDHAVIAHHRMLSLLHAINLYLNDNEEQFDDPLHLSPDDVPDPLTFWHPGDNDPAPTTIDNSIPNAFNSAQVSFVFQTGFVGELRPEAPLIWDASPLNNNGRFISVLTVDRTIETIPPTTLPFPTNIMISQHHMGRLASALNDYQNDHQGVLPGSLLELWGELSSPRSFWSPGDSDPMPTDIDNDIPNAMNSASISYDFPAAGMSINEFTLDTIILQDNSPANNAGLGVNVVRFRFLLHLVGGLGFVPENDFGDSDGDGDIDLVDWAEMQRCFRGWSDLLENNICHVMDFNANLRVESDDNQQFVEAVSGPF